jgi:hypothetical protein
LKCTERVFEAEFIQRIHSSFALISVQSDSFPLAMSTVHFAVRTAAVVRELAGVAVGAQNASVNPKQTIETKAA